MCQGKLDAKMGCKTNSELKLFQAGLCAVIYVPSQNHSPSIVRDETDDVE